MSNTLGKHTESDHREMILRMRGLEHFRTVWALLLLFIVRKTWSVDTGGINLGSGSSYGEQLLIYESWGVGIQAQLGVPHSEIQVDNIIECQFNISVDRFS